MEKVSDYILTGNNCIYDNKIEYYFHEYFENRGISLSGNDYKQVPMNVFQGAFRYVFQNLFKLPDGVKGSRGKKTIIDYDDCTTLNYIIDIYTNIVYQYDIKSTVAMFRELVGISSDTLYSWINGDTRTYIYKDNNGNIISNINEYIMNNRGEYIKEPSKTHSELMRKITGLSKETAYNVLNDSTVGQITHANNSKEAGMEYNVKRQIEAVKVQALAATELPKLGNITDEK